MHKWYAVKENGRIVPKLLEAPPQNAIAAYFSLPDDGAKMTCDDCGESKNPTQFYMCYTPDGKNSGAGCKVCTEEWCREFAEYGGMLPF